MQISWKQPLAAALGALLLVGCAAPELAEPRAQLPRAEPVLTVPEPIPALPAPAPAPPAKPLAAAVVLPEKTVPAPLPVPVPERAAEPAGLSPAHEVATDEEDDEPETIDGAEPLGRGLASWYGPGFHGRLTANGERFDRHAFTAAHRTLPFGTRLCVRSAVTGKTVQVRVNDRGPFTPGREIDLSQGAAQVLGLTGLGIKAVDLWQLTHPQATCSEKLPQLTAKARNAKPAPAQAQRKAKIVVRNAAAPRRRR